MFKFVNTDASNPTGKRKQSQRACDFCRKRKKRCQHNDSNSTEETSNGNSSQLPPSSPNDTSLGNTNELQETPIVIGVGHSPVALCTEQSTARELIEPRHSIHHSNENSELDTSSPSLNSRFIGDLNPEGVFLAASPGATRGASSNDGVGLWLARALTNKSIHTAELPSLSQSSLFYGSSSLLPKVLVPVLEEETLLILPPTPSLIALSSLYFEKLHPIIPLIDRNNFQNLATTDPCKIVLQQGICLATSKSFISSQHLILPGSDTPLKYRDFGNRISAAMRLILELGLVTDKIVRIQAFGLMAQFADGPDSADIASQLFGRSMQHLISLGLHVQSSHQRAEPYGVTLFCCIWALDRMNAAFHGRPVMMHERDIAQDLEQCILRQQPNFRLLLEVVLLLDKVIALYRWSYDRDKEGVDVEFTSFEELIARCPGSEINTQFLATIETFYHAVAMLSYRSKTSESPNGSQRSSISYLRQSLASARLSSTPRHVVRDQLILFPFVPYSFSLSLSIAYREMRYNKISMSRARARTQFQSNCDVLSELGEIFWSASTMAEMGKSTLKEMDRVYSIVAVSEQQKSQPGSGVGESSSTGTQLNFNSTGVDTSDSTSSNQTQSLQQQMPDFDPSNFDSISDLDLFGMFDPTFDLNSIDACFGGNLDLSFPAHLR